MSIESPSKDPWEGWSWEDSEEDSFSQDVELVLQNLRITAVFNSTVKLDNTENKT